MREIETERLLLRKVRREDAADIYAHYANDPEVTKYMTWNVHESIDTTNAVMDFWLGDYDKPECYRWGIVRRADQEFMGMIDVVGYHEGIPVIGYCSGRAYWGNGYMTEALNAVLKQLKEDGFHMALIEAVRENTGSNRVIQKAGGIPTGSHGEAWPQKNHQTFMINSYRIDL